MNRSRWLWSCLLVVGAMLSAAPADAMNVETMNNTNADGSLRIADPDERYFVGGEDGPVRALKFGDPASSTPSAPPASTIDRSEKWSPDRTRLIFGPFNRDVTPTSRP